MLCRGAADASRRHSCEHVRAQQDARQGRRARARAPFLAAEPKIRSKSALAALPFHLVEAARTLRSTHSAAHPLTTKDLQMWVWSAKTWLALQGVVNKMDAPDVLSKVGPRAS